MDMPAIATLLFYVMSDIVVLYCDPENADMVNPHGEVYGYAVYVVCEDPHGYRWRHFKSFVGREEGPQLERAGKLRDRIAASTMELSPGYWRPTYASYCSPAYDEECAWQTPRQLAGED